MNNPCAQVRCEITASSVHAGGIPYAELENAEFVTVGEELFVDYGPGFNYAGFTR